MLFYIVPLMCVFFKLSSAGSSCSQARDDDFADPFLPTVELKIIEFPNENILPIGYNITIACISNTSNTRGELVDLPFWIQFYYNSPVKVLHYCGGSDNATKEDSGNYSCWAVTQRLCAFRKIELHFREPKEPIFTVDLPNEMRTIRGNKDTLTCQASGTPRPVITWFKNGRLLRSPSIKGTKAYSTLTFDPISISDQGNYWCEASNVFGSKKTSTVAVSVLMKPVIRIHPKNVSASLNDGDITLECAAEGSPNPVITWLKNNTTMVSETSNTQNGTMSFLTIIIHKKMKTENYRCMASNSFGIAFSQTATVYLLEEGNDQSEADAQAFSSYSWSFLWPTVSIAVAVLLLLLCVILAVFKHKQWKKDSYLLTNEIARDRELFQLKIRNGMDIIPQLRLSQAINTSTNSSQERTVSTTDDHERYVQIMRHTNNRNWEIPRDRIIIPQEKLGGEDLRVENKGIYLRSDRHQLPVAVKQVKSESCA
ncbi:Hemicentin-1 [Acropora cervicornis]|uniref:Hemicentin-1 n=1 Tax=Acropora cervicornis TaxID=6130 RepID=A0AAD9VCI7_ACRCE|nr:Hemicentin-1 [Acropora cervicornis]